MVKLKKIKNGLIKVEGSEGNDFLNTEKFFTNKLFLIDVNGEMVLSGLPYEKLGDKDVSVELEENILLMVLESTTVDGLLFRTQDDFINYVFNEK
jgi:hypothetical protein